METFQFSEYYTQSKKKKKTLWYLLTILSKNANFK
jgi:hypothetical protein